MKFNVDTNDFENIKLEINSEEFNNPQNLITDFCYATAAFYISLTQRLNASIKQVRSFQEVCVPLIEDIINSAIKDGLFYNDLTTPEE